MIDKDLIQQAKEKIGDDAADLIADVLQIEKYDRRNKKGCCPFHQERTPSFVWDSKSKRYHCFGACNKSVDIVDAFIEGQHLTFNQAVSKVFELAGMDVPMPEVGLKSSKNYRYPKLTNADKKPVYEYLAMRGISKEVVDYAGLSCDGKGNIEIPFYDSNDVLKTVKLRPARKIDKSKGDIKTWVQKDTDHENVLFLQHLANPEFPLMLCEGEFDALAAIQAGYKNVVSIPFGCGNTKFIDEQWDFFEQFDIIIVAGDNDEAGRKFTKEVVARLGQWKCRGVQYPTTFAKPDGTKIAISDTNEVLYYYGAEKLLDCIYEAINKPIPTVVDFADTQDFDISKVGGVNFGLKEVDKELMRVFDGSVTILFAKAASGKTSLTNILTSNALDDGKSVFLYSQELANNLTANWILYSLAGRRNINSFTSKEGTPYYKVTPNARDKILQYYKNQLFIYRDGESIDIDDILKSAEMCVRREGVSLVILDNQTCMSCKGCESDLMRQTEIVRKCVHFAITFNCALILCSHSRKTNEGLGLDDIMGSSNSGNLAHRVLALERDGQGVNLKIIKDRLLGKSNVNIKLAFDFPSRRFFSPSNAEAELNRVYKWDKGECIASNPPVSIALEQVKQQQLAETEVFGE